MENDYELVALAQENNEEAKKIIYQKYKPIIIKKSKSAILLAPHHGIEINDIMQEGYIALEEAIKNFKQDEVATFYTFATLCIERKINGFIRQIMKGKNKLLNEALPFDDGLENLVKDEMDIEKTFLVKAREKEFVIRLCESLTSFERKVFDLKRKDYTFYEIANTLNKDIKSIYNTFQRIKQKMKKIMEIDD